MASSGDGTRPSYGRVGHTRQPASRQHLGQRGLQERRDAARRGLPRPGRRAGGPRRGARRARGCAPTSLARRRCGCRGRAARRRCRRGRAGSVRRVGRRPRCRAPGSTARPRRPSTAPSSTPAPTATAPPNECPTSATRSTPRRDSRWCTSSTSNKQSSRWPGLAVVDAHAAETSSDRVVQPVRGTREPTERAAEEQRRRLLSRVEAVAEAHDDAVGSHDLHDADVRCDPRLGDRERTKRGDAGAGALTDGVGEGVQAVSLSRRRTCTQGLGS